jgi:hypothetical protein
MDVVFDGAYQDGFESPKKALKKNGTLVCVGMDTLLHGATMGAFGAPVSAFWAKAKAQYFMGNTHFYELWESYVSNQQKFKVRRETI